MPSAQSELSDQRLLRNAAHGDAEAFGVLYDRYLDRIYEYVYYRVSNHMEAEDLTETIFLKAWEALPKMKSREDGSNFRAWLYRIAHNTVIDHYRTRKANLPLKEAYYLPTDQPGPEAEFQAGEQSERLAEAISQLEPNFQQVLVCRFVNGLSHAETAEIMELKEGHVRVLQHRALLRLRELLEGSVQK